METKERDLTPEEATVNHEKSIAENVLATLKPFLLAILGVTALLGIWVLVPMFFTYLSEGDTRPPSQIHPADPAGKSDHTIYKPQKSNN